MSGPRTPDRQPAAAALLACEFDRHTLVKVRHEVERVCRLWGLADLTLYRFVVAVNEITTNAVRHGGGRGHLRLWEQGRRLCCRVLDHGPGGAAEPRLPPPDHPRGRGLWLARNNVESFLLHSDAHGTTIVLEIS
ncbi:ATP-binding protein [Actinomadura sp. ATCC 31491]|uniref:ATP-binding protein n=1 Tax=Actinomadura luzonensis TaxID=2805427 RepID=A0ABT0FUC3_9ACTN|nr:ATP-binding protein [Actinomadura luzonensis]MCK2215935.1 ATP-binding protein [Actinomadura luzonensis]